MCAGNQIAMAVCPPQQQGLASPVGPGPLTGFLSLAFCFPARGTPLPSLHVANPSPLPRIDLWSLSLSAQPIPNSQRLCSPGWWCWPSGRLSLCCALLIPAAVLFSGTEVLPSQLMSLSVRWLPRVWVPFHSSLSGVLVPS